MFFPFTFLIDSRADVKGAKADCHIFKKQLFSFSKSFEDEVEEEDFGQDEFRSKIKEPSESKVVEGASNDSGKELNQAKDDKVTVPEESDKKEKPSLTDEQFWTILLTPEFDVQAWWAVKKLVRHICRLLHLKFYNCFVEGLRFDYDHMGELAALNAFLKSYPYIGAWDFRMDWTMDHELCAECHIRAKTNLTRFIGLCIAIVFYGGITAIRFWRRRAHVLKTGELPELGWIRRKIVKMMAED